MGELITVHEYWGNYTGTTRLGKLYPTGRLVICEPYVESEEADGKDICDFSADSDEQE
ncbi:hypothetical protein [Geobacillus vulcani]|uniref:hypothetical protein n=1 Tax=Geobacillus vulcani TaxID=135517 RepID=UPI000AEDBF9F|nr:hypothetical protein [Geobacillus vulcani]